MTDNLKSRVSRLIAGSFHTLVDAVENTAPEMVMEQAIREVEAVVAEVRNQLGKVETQRHLAARRLAEDSRRHEELSEQSRMAISQGRDDLASAAVERQLDLEAQQPVLDARLADLAEQKKTLESYLTALQGKRREMESDLREYREVQSRLNSEGPAAQGSDFQLRAERAGTAFARIYQRQTGIQITPQSRENASRLVELEDLTRRSRVAERLAQIASEIKGT